MAIIVQNGGLSKQKFPAAAVKNEDEISMSGIGLNDSRGRFLN